MNAIVQLPFRLSICVLALVGAWQGYATTPCLRLLSQSEESNDVRGSWPDCSYSYINHPCTDRNNTCGPLSQSLCSGATCTACTFSAQTEDCPSYKPWLIYDCVLSVHQGTCGNYYATATCFWDAAQSKCVCIGSGGTSNVCRRYVVTAGWDCIIVP
jgi:hypothetical protein